LAKERRARAARALVWLIGAALGAGALLTLTMRTWGSQFPVWVGVLVVAATMLCGDVAERAWQRISGLRGPGLDAA
jgi:hypothetical protein